MEGFVGTVLDRMSTRNKRSSGLRVAGGEWGNAENIVAQAFPSPCLCASVREIWLWTLVSRFGKMVNKLWK
jgi:hypothetical protein